jgi:hypothetical protein
MIYVHESLLDGNQDSHVVTMAAPVTERLIGPTDQIDATHLAQVGTTRMPTDGSLEIRRTTREEGQAVVVGVNNLRQTRRTRLAMMLHLLDLDSRERTRATMLGTKVRSLYVVAPLFSRCHKVTLVKAHHLTDLIDATDVLLGEMSRE